MSRSRQRRLAGQSGLRRLPDAIVGVVPSLDDGPVGGFAPDRGLPAKDRRKIERFILSTMAAADGAIAMADRTPRNETPSPSKVIPS